MARNPKVFCSHRWKDKPRVKEVALQLAAAGIDPWVDEWEIRPGDDFVALINRGLESCDAGLIFFSNEVEGGKWVQAEIGALTVQAVEDGKPLIPVLLDPGVPIPPLLRPRSRLGSGQIEQLIDAIYGRTGKPAVAPPRVEVTRRRFIVRLRKAGAGQVAVAAEADGKPLADEEPVRLGPGFHYSYSEFLHALPADSRQASLEEVAAQRERDLRQLGRVVGRVIFPGAVDRALDDLLNQVASAGEQLELAIETADVELVSIPFEAASLSNGRVPALEPGVTMSRRLAGCSATAPKPRPGPLKILVAVGAPDEDKTPNTVLDYERELQSILDAVEEAQRFGNAAVRILEVGSLEEIQRALEQEAYHVLHLSGHGRAGTIELEDEDGAPVPATAAQLADAVRESGRPAPLVFLASCHSGGGDTETAGLAQELLRKGVPAVIAMQSAVSDSYATQLAKALYDGLSKGERPLASVALAHARRELERERRKTLERGEREPGLALAEYATPSLFLAANEEPLFDRALPLEPLKAPTRMPGGGVVPRLTADELIGRRRELRRLLRVLKDDPRVLAAIGRKAGYQLTGIGGAGKSALAGRAIARMEDAGWLAAEVSGQWTLSQVATAVGVALMGHPQLADAGRALIDPATDERAQIDLLGRLLAQAPLLLVLDNFEDNLQVGGAAYLDAATEQVMERLCQAAGRGKLLITSRYPAPRSEDWLATEQLGPLSAAETRKLCLRLPALRRQAPEDLQTVYRAVGGHPRALEYLNAILNPGQARMPDVARRLREKAKELNLDLQDSGLTLERAVRVTLEVAARDILLDELLELVGEDREVLFQVSVFPMPVPEAAAASCLKMDHGEAAPVFERLGQSSLVTRLHDEQVWVHRWTAESLRSRMGEERLRQCCRRGGAYLEARGAESRSLDDHLAAVRLFLTAAEYGRATEIGEGILDFLRRFGRVADRAMLARELAHGVPQDHERHFVFLGVEADALLALGLTREALQRWQGVLQTLERRSQEHPERADYLRDLSVSYNKVGDLMGRLGEGEQARQFYQKALEIAERLVRQEPERADYLRDLSVSYNKMGYLMGTLGEGEQARQFFQKALELRERLVRQEPERADYLRDLSVSYERMGDLMGSLGEGEQARQFYRKALEIAERLVRQEPDRADYLRDLSVSYNKTGDLMGRLGEGEQARQFYRKALEIAERLVRQEPDRADYLRDLGVSYNRMGDLMGSLGEGEQARQFYQKALEIAERLVRQEPERADYLRDLSVSYNKMGDLMGRLGEDEQARQFYRKDLEIAERLVRQEPERADYQTDLVVSLVRSGTRESLEKALAILRRLRQEGKLSAQQSEWVSRLEQALS
jgi:tetratricopeptide (TPR) repeat protein